MARSNLNFLAARLFNTELLVRDTDYAALLQGLQSEFGLHFELPDGVAPSAFLPLEVGSADAEEPPTGVAVIPVHGKLVSRSGYLDAMSGLTSYQMIQTALDEALSDPAVRRIVLDMNTPGGEASLVEDAAFAVRRAAQIKPTTAFVHDLATSAGYYIASAAGRVVATPTAETANIGVIWGHADISKALENQGVKVTLVYAGARKADGWPYAPLSEDALSAIQARIDRRYDRFVEFVAAHRGIEDAIVRATEAAVLGAQEARDIGLVDAVMPAHDFFDAENDMANKTSTATTVPALDVPTQEAKASEQAAPVQESKEPEQVARGGVSAREQERQRIAAILRAPEAEGRMDTAISFALDTDLPAEQAVSVLKTVPKAAASATLGETAVSARGSSGTGFREVMDRIKNPDVGASAEDRESEPDEDAAAFLISQMGR